MADSSRFPRAILLGLLALLVVQAVIVGLQVHGLSRAVGDARLGIVAPPIVAQTLSERADALPGRPVDASPVAGEASALDAVGNGTLDGAVVVDFRADTDVLLVSAKADPEAVAGLRAQVSGVSASYDRSLTVREVAPAHHPDAWRGLPSVLTLCWVAAGLMAAAALTIVRGPVAPSWGAGAERLAVLAVVGVLLGLGGAAAAEVESGGPLLGLTVVGAAVVIATSWTTLALERLAGLFGIALAVALAVVYAGSLVTLSDPRRLSTPWSVLAPWTIQVAGSTGTDDLMFAAHGFPWRAVAVLAAWSAVAVLILVLARREAPASDDGRRPPAAVWSGGSD